MDKPLLQYSQRHQVINHCDRPITNLGDTEISFALFKSLCFNFFHLLARNPNLENFSIYSNKFFHNFHLSESSFTCPRLRASGDY